MKTKILLFVTLLSITSFISCNSESTNDVVNSETITTDDTVVNSEIDATVDDVSIIAEDQFDMQKSLVAKTSSNTKTTTGGMKSMLPACATVTSVLTNDTWTKTIDFGTQGCALPNGNIVKGKIIVSFSKNFTTPIKTITYKLEGFYHNGKLIEGNKTITHELKVSDLLATIHPVTTHSIDVKVTFPEGKIYTRVGTRVREMVEGFATITNWEDNVFKVWGYHLTTFPNGSKYNCKILESPLVIKMSCKMPFPVSGIVNIEKNDAKATLDYGKGECDNLATMTINGVSKEIELKK
ncbi:MAG TPA: hypothetical protein VN182_06440 [Flavobacterium sp.]|nr:hypothetical protein [Flavobacterium sp.]